MLSINPLNTGASTPILQVQTNFEMVGEKQFLITIPDADNINHVVVFLTGAVAFPEGFSGLGKPNVMFLDKCWIKIAIFETVLIIFKNLI